MGIPSAKINQADPYVNRFFLPGERPMVGRENYLPELVRWLKKNSEKDVATLLVEGEAGVGKTAFINQLALDLRADFEFYVYGKFHHTPSGVPYIALKQCLHHWLDQLLLLEDHAFEQLRQNVRQAVHPHEDTLTSVFEELEVLLGKKVPGQSDSKSDPQKERYRFTYNFHKFLRAVNESGFRTIIFLDDLQWADMATINLIHDLLKMYEIPGLVLIGAYRNQLENQPLRKINKIRQIRQVRHFNLPPLTGQDLKKLLPIDWKLQEEEEKAFMEYLNHESGGKPFDALQLLTIIVQERLIAPGKNKELQIRWNKLPRFKHDQTTIRLVMREILEMKPGSIKLLQVASCIGFYCLVDRLQKMSGLPEADFTSAFQELVTHKMMVLQQETCFFVHDHYFTAAQELIPAEEKQKYHVQLAVDMMAESPGIF